MTSAPHVPASRNARCPCGSGRRYKVCHGMLATTSAPATRDSLAELMASALAAHESGRLDEAARHYERVLAFDPQTFDALHMLGVVNLQRHDYERAATLVAAARLLRPDDRNAQHNQGLVEDGRWRRRTALRYRDWIALVETPGRGARLASLHAAASRSDAPRFSILLPTYDTPPAILAASLASVLGQVWPHWELCIADDASMNAATRETIRRYAAREERIRVIWRETNGHISMASNTALSLASAPFSALFDHDDVLPPDALGEVALAILGRPDAAIVYSDEDKIDEDGERFDPYFKPDWNPALIRAQNFVSHLGVFRTDVVRAVGGFREGLEGAQDWDLLLRCADRVDAATIVHVPRILYHWRSTRGSTAHSMEAKTYAGAAQERAVREHAERGGTPVSIRRVAYGAFLQADPVVAAMPPVSLIVLHSTGEGDAGATGRWREYAGSAVTEVLAAEVAAGTAPPPSAGAAFAMTANDARCVNAVAARARGEVLVLVASRMTPMAPEWLAWFVAHALQPGVGVVGGVTLDADQCVASGPYILDPDDVAVTPFIGYPANRIAMGGRNVLVQSLAAVRLDSLAVRRDAWMAAGGLDTTHLAAGWQDVDLCLRIAESGLAHVWHPGVAFLRDPVAVEASAPVPYESDRAYLRARHGPALAADPAYNPNLGRAPLLFEIAVPGDADGNPRPSFPGSP